MDPAETGPDEDLGLVRGALIIDGGLVEIALPQADATAGAQVDGGVEDHRLLLMAARRETWR